MTAPKEGQHVKCFLRNGNVVEGIVEVWDIPVILKTLDGASQMIIHAPSQDIMLTKVLLAEEPTVQAQEQTIAEKIKERVVEEGQPEPDPMDLNAMTKAQLHIQLVEQERQIVADQLKTHYPDSVAPRKKTYGYPGFFKKPSTK